MRERGKSLRAICQNPEVRFKCWRNAYPKVLWLPRFSMLIMCLQIRDEEKQGQQVSRYQPSDLYFQQRQKSHLMLAVAFVSVYIAIFACIHTQEDGLGF